VGQWLGDWAIPESIVMCESGGNWDAVNPSSGAGGAYQILPSTWELYGGEGNPEDASPSQQSDVAAQIWADSGSAAWECAG
jgi:muramidase (phage lysozyme)